MIKFDYKYATLKEDIFSYQEEVTKAHQLLENKTGKGNDYLGWYDWPLNYDKDEFKRIQDIATMVREDADIFLVCGIGGSYLGARAAIEMIQGVFAQRKTEIIYVGNTFSSTYLAQLLDKLSGKSVYLNVISKSGGTTETALAFRILKQHLEKVYGEEEAKNRIIVTTDAKSGTLHELAQTVGYKMLSIPRDIGGRFSVITAVGLLPIAVAGIDIKDLMDGALASYNDLKSADLKDNQAYQYAVVRHILGKDYDVELFVSYETQMVMFGEWWKQLFGESEGKEGKGIFPASANFSTDLHSLGQFVQEGRKCLFETVLMIEKPLMDVTIPSDEADLDKMNYLSSKTLDYVNKKAFEGTLMAHKETGNVNNLLISIPDNSAYTFGYLVYFYFRVIAMAGYLLDINPFDQPGVEVYKQNMFKLLGKK